MPFARLCDWCRDDTSPAIHRRLDRSIDSRADASCGRKNARELLEDLAAKSGPPHVVSSRCRVERAQVAVRERHWHSRLRRVGWSLTFLRWIPRLEGDQLHFKTQGRWRGTEVPFESQEGFHVPRDEVDALLVKKLHDEPAGALARVRRGACGPVIEPSVQRSWEGFRWKTRSPSRSHARREQTTRRQALHVQSTPSRTPRAD